MSTLSYEQNNRAKAKAFMNVVHEYTVLTAHQMLFNATIAEGGSQRIEHNDIKWITPSEVPNHEICPTDEGMYEK